MYLLWEQTPPSSHTGNQTCHCQGSKCLYPAQYQKPNITVMGTNGSLITNQKPNVTMEITTSLITHQKLNNMPMQLEQTHCHQTSEAEQYTITTETNTHVITHQKLNNMPL